MSVSLNFNLQRQLQQFISLIWFCTLTCWSCSDIYVIFCKEYVLEDLSSQEEIWFYMTSSVQRQREIDYLLPCELFFSLVHKRKFDFIWQVVFKDKEKLTISCLVSYFFSLKPYKAFGIAQCKHRWLNFDQNHLVQFY